jgi:hypothetical protein
VGELIIKVDDGREGPRGGLEPMTDHSSEHKDSEVILSVDSDGHMHIDRESLPIVPPGEHLVEHEVYIDTFIRGHGPFRALAGQVAGSGNGYVAEKDVDLAIWDLLVREDGEARLQHEEETAMEPNEGHLTELGAVV